MLTGTTTGKGSEGAVKERDIKTQEAKDLQSDPKCQRSQEDDDDDGLP